MTKLISDREVAVICGVSYHTVWRWTRELVGFPQPIRPSSKCTRWRASEIAEWIDSLGKAPAQAKPGKRRAA